MTSQVQVFGIFFIDLHEFPACSFHQPVEVPLNSSKTIWSINYSQFCIICKLAEGLLCPMIQVLNDSV